MNVHFMCAYYSQYAHEHIAKRTQKQWHAYKFAKAVKTKEINGDLSFPWKLKPHEKIDQSNVARARSIFGYFLNSRLEDLGLLDASIVPIPSKDGIVGAKTFRSLEMVRESLIPYHPDAKIEPIVRLTHSLQKASEGGPRGREELRPFICIVGRPASEKIVLVDDIFTTGGSILSAYDVLKDFDIETECAICCAHTVSDSLTAPFGVQMRSYDPNLEEI
jgi:phosphoribosylpyrophosphate synthetase